MDSKTIVLSSARAIRHEQLSQSQTTTFLPHYITMGEFISNLCIVQDAKAIDDDTRILLLLQASDFDSFKRLQIERNFLTFTKNSSFIFKFFEELSGELYELENLLDVDLYGEFENHIQILIELKKRYEVLCSEQNLLDRIFLPKNYRFNTAYAASLHDVVVHLDGYLTNFELKILEQLASHATLTILFHATAYNIKMQKKFEKFGFELRPGFRYELDMTHKKIHNTEPFDVTCNVTCNALSEDLLQVGFIHKKIYDFVRLGYDPSRLAVIVPDEKKAEVIELLDKKGNYNFAMGKSFTQTHFYQLIDAHIQYLNQETQENQHRVKRFDKDILESIITLYGSRDDMQGIAVILEQLGTLIENSRELKIYKEELHSFIKLLPFMQKMGSKSILNLFMQRLAKRALDDVRGGKITVMGVLESRGVEFDGVVIIDFNESSVPKKSDKDMFLNTTLREHAGLPTIQDRESLQKHYYYMLLHNSKEVAISYVQGEQMQPSRFLKQLGIITHNQHDEKEFANILFRKAVDKPREDASLVIPYDFTASELSSSKLKTYLTCTQRFYYRYIQKLYEHEIPQDLPKEHEIGNDVHQALANLYAKQQSYESVESLQKDLEYELDSVKADNELTRLQLSIQKKLLQKFCVHEVERFVAGYKVYGVELELKRAYQGLMLQGRIDRIDTYEGMAHVLDYKTGSYTLYNKNNVEDATDYQLEFYHLLASTKASVASCGFYDLKDSKIVPEAMFEQKMEQLDHVLGSLRETKEIEVQKCEDIKHCLYCPYKILCERI